jgi:hypothetical protein
MNTPLPFLGKLLKETNHEAAREARRLDLLIRSAAKLDLDTPLVILEMAADEIGWQKVRVFRALEGKPQIEELEAQRLEVQYRAQEVIDGYEPSDWR